MATTKEKKQECFNIFENFLFDDERNQDEADTERERVIYENFESFVTGNLVKRPKQAIVNAMKQLKRCQGVFPKDLTPESNILYRGSRMKIEDIERLIGKEEKHFFKVGEWVRIKGRFKGKSIIQSWSTDKEVAISFSFSGQTGDVTKGVFKELIHIENKETQFTANRGTVPIVYEIKAQDKNLLFSTNFTNFFSRELLGVEESEVVRLTNTSIAAWIYMPQALFNKYSKQGRKESDKVTAAALKDAMELVTETTISINNILEHDTLSKEAEKRVLTLDKVMLVVLNQFRKTIQKLEG